MLIRIERAILSEEKSKILKSEEMKSNSDAVSGQIRTKTLYICLHHNSSAIEGLWSSSTQVDIRNIVGSDLNRLSPLALDRSPVRSQTLFPLGLELNVR